MSYKNVAEIYSRSRPAYPKEIFDTILANLPAEKRSIYVDIGCGTGELLLPLSPFFSQSIGVDPDEDMLAMAHKKIKQQRRSCELIQSSAERYFQNLNKDTKLSLVTAGRSFHWMDQPLVTQLVYEHLIPGGIFVTLGEASGGIWRRKALWAEEIRKIIFQEFPHKDLFVPAKGHYVPLETMKENLRSRPFSQIIDLSIKVQQAWTYDAILNLFYSAAGFLEWLGEDKSIFDSRVKSVLSKLNSEMIFSDLSVFGITLCIK